MVIVGGKVHDAESVKQMAVNLGVHNIIFAGFVKPSLVPLYLKAADILIHYSPPGFSGGMKLIEYMASRRPRVGIIFIP